MKKQLLFFSLALVLWSPALRSEKSADRPSLFLAATPPMGWNSWDSYGTTIKEAEVKANAEWLARHLKRFGWQYVVVDMEWFVTNPVPAGNSPNSQFSIDNYGRYTPAMNRFPSAAEGAGFKPLADYVHSLGLKFGLHILRGIPKQAVAQNLPIAGSSFPAADAADPSTTCPWNPDNYDLDVSKPAGQAYYDSIAQLYARWEVDFVKADCISSRPYKGDDIRMLSLALHKTGRPIALSLSPGAAPLEKVEEMRLYAQSWRISDDIWDLWHSNVDYPQGLGDQFPRIAPWAPFSQPGHWPDADILPLGYLGPAPGWGSARQTRLTRDEQKTLFTLWCMFRSPLMMGGNLPENDSWTTSLLTNDEVIAVDQHSTGNRPLMATDKTVVWIAQDVANRGDYVAVFNLKDSSQPVRYRWKDLGLAKTKYRVRDLWQHKNLGQADSITVTLPPHGAVLYGLTLLPNHSR